MSTAKTLTIALLCLTLIKASAVESATQTQMKSISGHVAPTPEELEATDRQQVGGYLLSYFDLLDVQNGLLQVGSGPYSQDYFQSENLDLYVRQMDVWLRQQAKSMPEPRYRLTNKVAQTEICNLLMYCDFANAKEAIKRFTDSIGDQSFSCNYGEDVDLLLAFMVQADASTTTLEALQKLSVKFLASKATSLSFDSDTRCAWRLLIHQLTLLEYLNDPRMTVIADKLYDMRSRSSDMPANYKETLGNFFARHGQYLKASQCFKEALSSSQKFYSISKSPYLLLCTIYDSYKLSEIAQKCGNIKAALDYAQQSKKLLIQAQELHIASNPSQQIKIPELAEIDSQIARLNGATDKSGQPHYVEKENSEQRDWYSLYRQLDSSINKKDWSNCERLTDRILQIFDRRVDQPPQRFHLSWLDALLQMARKLSDNKRFDTSNKILIKLDAQMLARRWQLKARPFVVAELLVNQSRAGLTPDWSRLYKSMHTDLCDIDILRIVGLLYKGAGNSTRAMLFYDKALTLPADSMAKSDDAALQRQKARVLLLLDAANCYASGGNFARGQDLVKQALVLVKQSKIDRARIEWSNYNKAYHCKLYDYAKTMIEAKQYSEIENILVSAREKTAKSSSTTTTTTTTSADANANLNSTPGVISNQMVPVVAPELLLDAALGEIYYNTNRPQQALQLLRSAASACAGYMPYAPLYLQLLYAQCAAQCKDYKEAALSYRQLAMADPGSDWIRDYIYAGSLHQYFKDALECANKSSDFDPELKKQITLDFVRTATAADDDAKLATLMPVYLQAADTDQSKVDLARQIAEIVANGAFKSPENIKAAPQIRIDMLRKIAELVDSQPALNSSASWLELAKMEFRENRLDDARTHFKMAIAKFDGSLVVNDLPFIRQWDVTRYPIDTGSADERPYQIGKELLIEASKALTKAYGATSAAASLQQAQITIYDLLHRRYQSVDPELDLLLETNLNYYYDADEIHKNGVDALVEEVFHLEHSYTDEALKILQRILDKQIKDLGADDFHIALTYRAIGATQLKAKHYTEAMDAFRKSLAIQDLYGLFHDYEVTHSMAKILKSQGKEEDALSIERLTDLTAVPHPVSIDDKGKIAEDDFSLVLSEYHLLKEKYPYSKRCDQLLEALSQSAAQTGNIDLQITLLKERLEIAKRISHQINENFVTSKTGIKLEICRQLVSACRQKGELVKAKQYAMDSEQNIYRERNLPLLTALARVQLDAGQTIEATRLAEEASRLPAQKLKADSWAGDQLQDIWRRLGEPNRAAEIKLLIGS